MSKVELNGDTVKLYISESVYTLLDASSLPLLEGLNWTLQKRYGKRANHPVYVKAHIGGRRYVSLHRVLVAAPSGLQVDHINRNSLDNRLANLRFCTNAENVANQSLRSDNSSGVRGVFVNTKSKRRPWTAQVYKEGRTFYSRTFATKTEAALAYAEQASKAFGDFSNPEQK